MGTWCLFAATCVALLAGGYAVGRRLPRLTPAALWVLLAALGVRLLLDHHPAWEWALLPWPGYALVQGMTVYALAVTFLGLAAARLPVRWNRLVVVAVAVGLLAHGLQRNAWRAWPQPHGDDRVAGQDHHVRQSTIYTCGPAACVSALSYCGVVRTERHLSLRCGCRRGGSRLFDLYRALCLELPAERFAVSIEAPDTAALLREDLTVVTSNAGRGHAICIHVAAGRATLHDPLAKAPLRPTAAELALLHEGACIVIRAVPVSAAPR